METQNISKDVFYLKILQHENCNINLPRNLKQREESYVSNPISLSLKEFLMEDECTKCGWVFHGLHILRVYGSMDFEPYFAYFL